MPVPSIYRAVVAEIERRRVEVGWTCLELDNAAGLSSGYWAKCVHPDEPSGRRIRWEMLEFVIGALYADGYDLAVKPKSGALLNQFSMKYHIRNAAPPGTPTYRARMSEAGKKSAAARMEKLTPEQRSEVARTAARARWKRRMDAEGCVDEEGQGTAAGIADPARR